MNACVDCLVSLDRVEILAFEVDEKIIVMPEALGRVKVRSVSRVNRYKLVSIGLYSQQAPKRLKVFTTFEVLSEVRVTLLIFTSVPTHVIVQSSEVEASVIFGTPNGNVAPTG